MRKRDEVEFYRDLRRAHERDMSLGLPNRLADEVADSLGIHPKRAERLLEKWSVNGWWDYGVSRRTGWFTEAAPDSLIES